MNDQEDFLSRWSRRKRAVAEDEAAEAAKESPPDRSASAETRNAEPAEPTESPGKPAGRPGQVHLDPQSLPPLESIAAETDISAFLAPGVPADLARAALRRAWSADPAIRDFIGLSENLSETAWDISGPAGMAGFGTLELTDDLRRAVAQLFTPDPAAPPEPPSQRTDNTAIPPAAAGSSEAPEGQHHALRQDESVATSGESVICDQSPQKLAGVGAAQQQLDVPANAQSTLRRSHGRALPK